MSEEQIKIWKQVEAKGNTEAAEHGRYVRLFYTLPLCESESSTRE